MNNERYLFLDDIRSPSWVDWVDMPDIDPSMWNIIRDYDEFISFIKTNGLPRFISFDHDLALVDDNWDNVQEPEKEMTGLDCAHWLVEYCLDNKLMCPDFTVHSQNPPGRDNIEGLLKGFIEFQNKNIADFSDGDFVNQNSSSSRKINP